MKRDDANARAALEGDPYGVPTGGVPRIKRDWPTTGMCKHGFIPPENCADCNQMGVTQAPTHTEQASGPIPSWHWIEGKGVVWPKCPHGVPPDKCADCSESVNAIQYGGQHYKKLAIQPWDYVAANNLGYFEGSIVKYVSRWRDKGGIEDLKKARHFLDKLIEVSE